MLVQSEVAKQDLEVLEKTVPPHMMVLMIQACMEKGFEVRSDVLQHLNNAAVAPLARLDALTISRLARRTDEIALALLKKLSPDDPREGLYCCAMFVLQLVDEGIWTDAHHQAVLVSLLLIEDVKDDRKDVAGNEVVWKLEEKRWSNKAHDMMVAARLQGLYLTRRFQCN